MSAATATFDKVPMTCRTCTRPENAELRRLWGCDGPAPAALFSVDCPRCFGVDPACVRCGGSGEEKVDLCPWSTESQHIARVIEHAAMIESGILPVAGGLDDQTESFGQALKLVLSTRGKIEQKKAPPPPPPPPEARGRG